MPASWPRDAWPHSGFDPAARDSDGKLLPGDHLLRTWWRRPEVAPVEASCDAERALHAALIADPRRPVAAGEIAALQDADARENYGVVLAMRERLLAAPTVEAAYLDIFRQGNVTVPPVFIDQLAHLIVHGILHDNPDPMEWRAAELFSRAQKVSLQEGAVMLADAETVELHASGSVYGELGRLLAQAQIPARKVELDVLDRDNAPAYWTRNERRDTVIRFASGSAALGAFSRVLARWVRHFFGVEVTVMPLSAIEDRHWAWHIGLDAQATQILNDLYRGEELEPERQRRILSLFRLDFADPSVVRPDVAGRPVYLAAAMNEAGVFRMKPQNLLLNLPLASVS
ncbi:DUF6352 family protein [Cupriavidus sp. 2MCAB6]|uniref:DUF6352 family protein n=1 Tax=Cupriavidus sp. 2MCAB6 TaxID=3232981 RepID=UPI003F91557B